MIDKNKQKMVEDGFIVQKNIKQWIEDYIKTENKDDLKVQINLGWYDWFCENNEIPQKTETFYEIFKDITNRAILKKYEVQFKNCCPASDDPLYDMIILDEIQGNGSIVLELLDKRNEYPYTIRIFNGITFISKDGFNTQKELIEFINNL